MLMPGRYISDTSQHCMTISTTKWVTTTQTNWVSVCLPCLLWWEYGNGHLQLMHDTVALLAISHRDTAYGFAGTDISVTPGVPNRLLIDQIAINGQLRFAIMEDSGGTYKELTSVLADTRDRKLGPFLFTPTGNTIHLTVANLTPTKKVWWKIGTLKNGTTTTTTPVTVYETVCNEDKDKYRFGFNGQEKNNNWAGIGNHLDFKFRGYDSRTGRFISKDPLFKRYSYYSPYQFAGNTPIWAIDLEGLEPFISNLKAVYYNSDGSVTISADVLIKAKVLNMSNNKDVDVNVVAANLQSDLRSALNGASSAYFNMPFDFKNSKDNNKDLITTKYSKTRQVRYDINVITDVRAVSSLDNIGKDDWVYVMVNDVDNTKAMDVAGIANATGKVALGEAKWHGFGNDLKGRQLALHEFLHLLGAEDIYNTPKDNPNNVMSSLHGKMELNSDQKAKEIWPFTIGNFQRVWQSIRKSNYSRPKGINENEDTKKQIDVFGKKYSR